MEHKDELFNVNVNGNEAGFRYAVRYDNNSNDINIWKYTGGFDGDSAHPVQFVNGSSESAFEKYKDLHRDFSVFNVSGDNENDDFPELSVKSANITLYFPEWSIETFDYHDSLYCLKASTFINSIEVILCQKLIDRNDAVAAIKNTVVSNEELHEQVSFVIPDPYELCFEDDYETFRQEKCRWTNNGSSYTTPTVTDTNSLLCVELTPLKQTDALTYSTNEKWSAGSNTVALKNSNEAKDSLSVHLKVDKENHCISAVMKYDDTYSSLSDYLSNTYPSLNITTERCRFFMKNSNDEEVSLDYDSSEIGTAALSDGVSWNDYKDGLVAFCTIDFENDSGDIVFTLDSDNLPITPNVFSILLGTFENTIDENFLNELDMLNIVNRIENNIVNVDRPDDYNAHIVTPVFIRSNPAASITVHPKVTEYISIRLDAYKSSVKKFILKLEDSEFVEYARNGNGVVFKVAGTLLTQEPIELLYYILNENKELVTSGNCKYII